MTFPTEINIANIFEYIVFVVEKRENRTPFCISSEKLKSIQTTTTLRII